MEPYVSHASATGSGFDLTTVHAAFLMSDPVHTIRLRGAWIAVREGDRTVHTRHFGWPRTLDPDERVWLVCDDLPGPAEIRLNDEVVATILARGPFRLDITRNGGPRNTVGFSVTSNESVGEVTLEVHRVLG
ncbi:unnamed protein product [Gemmataceae bacterium]|nr:unnamed protein product [Gemmataceae bacterium]VTT96681.1 unnamed protein product [Gemmataceae bacterium]